MTSLFLVFTNHRKDNTIHTFLNYNTVEKAMDSIILPMWKATRIWIWVSEFTSNVANRYSTDASKNYYILILVFVALTYFLINHLEKIQQ